MEHTPAPELATAGRRAGGLRTRPSRWAWLVVASSALLLGVGAALAIWWFLTWRTDTTSYAVPSPVSRVEIVVDAGNVDVIGGGPLRVAVRRSERFAYDQQPREVRTFDDGVLRIASSCPPIVLGACSANYRLTVPDNVPVTVRSRDGRVRLTSYRGAAEIESDDGDIVVDAFCGYSLRARSRAGDVRVATACPPERVELRSGEGDVTAAVPAGSYRLDADSGSGRVRVAGIVAADDATWSLQALSSSGDVTVEGTE